VLHNAGMVRVEPAKVEWLEALQRGDEAFSAEFGIPVVPEWAQFPEIIPYSLEAQRSGVPAEWGTHLFFDETDGALVGNGGWKGPPVDGEAELGYAVAPDRQGRGIATSVVRELVGRAGAAGVRTVLAHTLPEPSASTTVLERCGFTRTGSTTEPGVGTVWRWELSLGDEPVAGQA
jgi:RimJ/RimL family protein N-acetyltransferase